MRKMLSTGNRNIGKVKVNFDVVYCVNCGCYLELVTDKCKYCKRIYQSLSLSKDVKGGIKKIK